MTSPAAGGTGLPWWQRGVLYQIYPRSFADGDGDGTGDLGGILGHLDHLAWLGVDGIWLSPVTLSPNADWGYDVADFCAVTPELGTMDQLDELVAEAGRRGIRILMDLVPNHTSDRHPWFVDARSSRDAAHRDWYVWADPKPDGSPPNNWVSSFGGPAWTMDPGTGQYYLHNHLDEQPDLNWWQPEVRDAVDGVMRFWFDRGVQGFRIDVCNVVVKDATLRDNPPATEEDGFEAQLFGQRSVYNANRPEVHDVIQRWRALADGYGPPRVLVGETPVDLDELVRYYGHGGDELHLAFNFPFIGAPLEADAMRRIVEDTERTLPRGAWPAWTGSNHDMSRLATRWAKDDPARARAALLMLLCLRGTPFLYQGDEIGLPDVPVPREALRDPLGVRYWPHYQGRDAMRTPMRWRRGPEAGFTSPGVAPWLPVGDGDLPTVEDQRDDPGSTLHLVRDLLALRRRTPDLHGGHYATVPSPPGTWVWRRGRDHLVAVNLGDGEVAVDGLDGRVAVGTDRGRDGALLRGRTVLAPWEGVVVAGPGAAGD
ncbi:MAG: alpha-amylase family glycosyl hydrolase [Acidimicrobiales bacterium]